MWIQWDYLATWMRARFGNSDRGATLVEYALLVALLGLVSAASVGLLGNAARSKFTALGSAVNAGS